MDTTRTYSGKEEILAAWRWGISYKDGGRPITTLGEATDAMHLAYRAFEERDQARAALGTLPQELAASQREAERLRTQCRMALDERDQAIEAFESGHEICDADLEAQKRLTRVALRSPKLIAAVVLLLIAIALFFN